VGPEPGPQSLTRRSPHAFEKDEQAADRATATAVWAMCALGALTILAGTAPHRGGPHAGGEGTGDVVHRFTFKGASTVNWLINRHGVLAAALGVLAAATWWLARRRASRPRTAHAVDADLHPARRSGRRWDHAVPSQAAGRDRLVHVALATLTWVGIVLAAMQVGVPAREPTAQLSARPAAPASAPSPSDFAASR
jgi:cytochrome c oxidase assembly protein subunit 15